MRKKNIQLTSGDEPLKPDGHLLPPLAQYVMGQICPVCGASPGQPCEMKRNKHRFCHHGRFDLGLRHRQRDIGKAPWPEERDPEVDYSTLEPDRRFKWWAIPLRSDS